MILFFWLIYLVLTFVISLSVRKLFKRRVLKIIFFSFVLSIFITPWFSSMGQYNLAPIVSILFMSTLEGDQILTMRLLRPFLSVFFAFVVFDSIFTFWKTRT
ncbi:MAG: hypothetical protein CL851_06710 [Crocinitomicaceae bacterium]|nr:hypothetical protein [Crocinitomicaceae bacterium]